VYVISHGGPGNTTESLTFFAYNTGLRYFDLGYASAIAFTLLVVVVALAVPIVIFVKKDVEFS
jgi:multiple sugar transport system permease protein